MSAKNISVTFVNSCSKITVYENAKVVASDVAYRTVTISEKYFKAQDLDTGAKFLHTVPFKIVFLKNEILLLQNVFCSSNSFFFNIF